MATLSVNVDHVATLRQARGGNEPDPVAAAAIAEMAGAEGIIVHLREDRRHIQDRDVDLIRQTVKSRLNLEMAATDEMLGIAADVGPFMSTLVPEKRQELTTEGGLDVFGQKDHVGRAIQRLHDAGIKVSLFVDAEERQIQAAKELSADFVEIHTGHYADATTEEEAERLFRGIVEAVKSAAAIGPAGQPGTWIELFQHSPVCRIARRSKTIPSVTPLWPGRFWWDWTRRFGTWPPWSEACKPGKAEAARLDFRHWSGSGGDTPYSQSLGTLGMRRFEQRVFAPGEVDFCRERARPANCLAMRFAAKEAFSKAVGLGLRSSRLLWRDIKVVHDEKGKPFFELLGTAARVADEIGLTASHLSLTDEAGLAQAFVVVETR